MADRFFGAWEELISAPASGRAADKSKKVWESASAAINQILISATDTRVLAWRGMKSHQYPLHSSLYRRLLAVNGPDLREGTILAAERRILDASRHGWRFDQQCSLELFSQLQHSGASTRLLDVTFNPWIALWFAVEQKFRDDGTPDKDVDGRVFAFDVSNRFLEFEGRWAGRRLPWDWKDTERDLARKWATDLPVVWRPPSYNERIPAQNSAFLIGGVPGTSGGSNSYYRKDPANLAAGTWRISEIRAVTSIGIRMLRANTQAEKRSVPTYSIRVSATAKPFLRTLLEHHFGLDASSMYPDLFGLARYSDYYAFDTAKRPFYGLTASSF